VSRRRTKSRQLGPWLRFALLGGLLFALDPRPSPRAATLPPAAAESDDALLVREALRRGFEQSDDVVRRRLVQNLRFARPDDPRSDDELVSEAIRLGMHESDLVVQRRLAWKMRLLLGEEARRAEPTEAELAAYLVAHAERFTEPARVTLEQLYFRDRASAEAALAALAAGAAPEALGNALPVPRELPSHSEAELAARLGPAFAAAALAAPDGRWFGPIASSYGQHLVLVHARTAARLSPLASVRSAVREALRAERADAGVRAGIAALRAG
jgi:parvulin-like peptidyl-prolyl isomerase